MAEEDPSAWPGTGDRHTSPPAGAPSTEHVRTPQAGQYYRVDSSRASCTELWRDARSPVVLIAWLAKLLRIKLPGSVNDPNVVSLRPFWVDEYAVTDTVPPNVLETMQPVFRELLDLGFSSPTYLLINDPFHQSRTCQVALLHRDGRSVARITHRGEGIQLAKVHFFTEFLSGLNDGTFLWSSSAYAQLFPPADCALNWNPKVSASQLWISHRQELATAEQSKGAAVVSSGREDMVSLLESHHESVRDFQLSRGVFAPMQGQDLIQAAALDNNLQRRTEHPEVMAHLERLQRKQTNWSSAIIVLIVSIALFIAAGKGAWKWSWEVLFTIVGVLIVHEAGHYVAMKVFRYSNVRMFFIPFLGAAVSGQNYTAPGWKKIVVSLMGPLPGILLGGALGIAGIINGSELMMRIALLAVILNGLQLLPVLPLDGGRVLHTLLFCRHHYLDTVFRVLAAVALTGFGLLLGDKILIYLGMFMFIGVPAAHKAGKIATELRKQGFGPGAKVPTARPLTIPPAAPPVTATGNETLHEQQVPAAGRHAGVWPPASATDEPVVEERGIPQSVAQAIIERTRQRFPRIKSPKQIAQLTLNIYETIATKPPGASASVGFALLHGASFVGTFVLLLVLVAGQNRDFAGIAAAGRNEPAHSIDPAQIEEWAGSPLPDVSFSGVTQSSSQPVESDGHDVVIATFFSRDEARQVFEAAKQKVPDGARLVCFGQSVLVSLPSSDESAATNWFDKLADHTDDVFIDAAHKYGFSLTLSCRATDRAKAKEIEEELSRYFDAWGILFLIPPWAGDDLDRRTDEERADHAAAREMYRRLQQANVYEAPELEELRDAMSRAARRNDEAEYDRLSEQWTEQRNQLTLHECEKIRDGEEQPVARRIAEAYVTILEEEGTSNPFDFGTDGAANDDDWEARQFQATARYRAELGPLMGQLSLSPDTGRPTTRQLRYSHKHGYVYHYWGRRLIIYVAFEDVSYGAPALLEWLGQQGCSQFKYEFTAPGAPASRYD